MTDPETSAQLSDRESRLEAEAATDQEIPPNSADPLDARWHYPPAGVPNGSVAPLVGLGARLLNRFAVGLGPIGRRVLLLVDLTLTERVQ